MGDRLATTDMGRKEGAAVPLSGKRGPGARSLSTREGKKYNMAWAEVYFRTKESWKLGGAPPILEYGLGPHLTKSRLGCGLPPYQVAS